MPRVLDPAQIESFAERSIPRLRLPDVDGHFAARAARLRELSVTHALGDYLRLMAVLCDAQQAALTRMAQVREEPSLRELLDRRLQLASEHGMPPLQAGDWPRTDRWRTVLSELCASVSEVGCFPAAVKQTCQHIDTLTASRLEQQAELLLRDSADDTLDRQAAPLLMAALQVYWSHLRRSLPPQALAAHAARVDVPGVCPICGTLPVASIVRADKAWQGYRYLHCALCDTQWHLVRITCSQCLSTEGIHYQTIEGQSPAVRAEACDQCRSYRKICYQEQDSRVEPIADDLATLPLDLLMAEAGFHRASGHPMLWQSAQG